MLNHTEPLSLASFALMHVIAANSKRFFKSRLHTQSLRLPAREERKRIKMEKYRGDRWGSKKPSLDGIKTELNPVENTAIAV